MCAGIVVSVVGNVGDCVCVNAGIAEGVGTTDDGKGGKCPGVTRGCKKAPGKTGSESGETTGSAMCGDTDDNPAVGSKHEDGNPSTCKLNRFDQIEGDG